MMASQDSRRSSLLRQKQRVQCLSRDTFTESSASGLSTFHWEEGTWKPLQAQTRVDQTLSKAARCRRSCLSATWVPRLSNADGILMSPPVSFFAHTGPWGQPQDRPAFAGMGCAKLEPL